MLKQDIDVANLVLDGIPPEVLWTVEAFWVSDPGDRLHIRTHEALDGLRLDVRVFLDVSLPGLLSRISPRRPFKSADLEGFVDYSLTVSGIIRGSLVGAWDVPPAEVTRASYACNGILYALWDILLSQEPLRLRQVDPFGQATRALGLDLA